MNDLELAQKRLTEAVQIITNLIDIDADGTVSHEAVSAAEAFLSEIEKPATTEDDWLKEREKWQNTF